MFNLYLESCTHHYYIQNIHFYQKNTLEGGSVAPTLNTHKKLHSYKIMSLKSYVFKLIFKYVRFGGGLVSQEQVR